MVSYRLSSPFLLPFWPASADDGMKNWLNCWMKQSGWDCVSICYTRIFAWSIFHLSPASGNFRDGRANQSRSWCINEACIKSGCRGIQSCPTLFLGMAAGALYWQELQSSVSRLSSWPLAHLFFGYGAASRFLMVSPAPWTTLQACIWQLCGVTKSVKGCFLCVIQGSEDINSMTHFLSWSA